MFELNDDPFGAIETTFQTGGPAPKANTSAPSFNAPQNKSENKYQILNMFWLINPKVYSGEAMLPNEVHFVTISFNINFGNLRIEVCNMTKESIKEHLVCLNKIQRLSNGTVYPTAMFQLVCKTPEVACMEQVINYDGSDWQNKINPVKFVTNANGNITMYIAQHCFEFTGWQKEALLYACKFGLNQGMVLSGENIIKK